MRYCRPFLAAVFAGIALSAFSEPIRIAVCDFETVSDNPEKAVYGKGLPSMVLTDLSRSSRVQVVERARIHDALAEQEFALSDLADAKTAATVGNLISAQYMLTGQLFIAGGKLRIDLRMITVETAAILFAVEAEGQEADIFSLEHELVSKVLAQLFPKASKETAAATNAKGASVLEYSQAIQSLDENQVGKAEALLSQTAKHDASFGYAQDLLDQLIRNR